VIDSQNTNLLLLGRYQILSELAKSPIGGLVLALDTHDRRVVALRSLPIENRLSLQNAALLLEAGKWVKGLDEAAVMKPLEIGTQDGVLHAVYQYCVSEPLRGVMRLASFKGDPMPVAVALRIAHDVALGARAIEACGASPALGDSLCGGLLPDSILVGQDGTSRICDAGISTMLRRTPEYGQQLEVLGYAAPEQLDAAGTADGRSDVFTIGILLWEVFANRRLFSASHVGDVIDKVRTMPVPALDSLQRGPADPIPQTIAGLVKRALERAPRDRYAGTTALLQALETYATTLMASPAQVGEYVSGLVGNIFETRSRALEHGLATNVGPEQRNAPAVVLKTVSAGSSSREPRLRAVPATNPKSSPKAAGPIPPPPPKLRATPLPKQRGSKPSTHVAPVTPLPVAPRSTMQSSPPIIAALMDDAIAREAKAAGTSLHPTLPPPSAPLEAVIPGLPKLFELPGAALFATPGLPPAKSVTAETQGDIATASAIEHGAVLIEPELASVETKLGSPPAELSELKILAVEMAAVESRATDTQHAQRPRMWMAVVSLLLMAFMGGLAIRRCTKAADRKTPTSATATVASFPVAATLASFAQSAQVADASASAVQPVVVQTPDASVVSEVVDAGVARKPAAQAPQSAPRVRKQPTSAPRYNSRSPKVTSPKVTSPRVTSSKVASPKATNSKVTSPKVTNSKVTSPKVTSSKVTSPKVTSSKVTSSSGKIDR